MRELHANESASITRSHLDAEYILTEILHRTRFTVFLRDDLASALRTIAAGDHLTGEPKRKWNKYT